MYYLRIYIRNCGCLVSFIQYTVWKKQYFRVKYRDMMLHGFPLLLFLVSHSICLTGTQNVATWVHHFFSPGRGHMGMEEHKTDFLNNKRVHAASVSKHCSWNDASAASFQAWGRWPDAVWVCKTTAEYRASSKKFSPSLSPPLKCIHFCLQGHTASLLCPQDFLMRIKLNQTNKKMLMELFQVFQTLMQEWWWWNSGGYHDTVFGSGASVTFAKQRWLLLWPRLTLLQEKSSHEPSTSLNKPQF